jgi:hypothetical protein
MRAGGMTKIWVRSDDPDEYTEAQNLDIKAYAHAYLEVKPCGSLAGRFPPNTRLELLTDHAPPDFFEVGTLFVVSERLRAVLSEYKVHAEFFPLRVIHEGAEYTERRFYFCNVLNCLECFDLARGKYTFWKKPGFTDHVKAIKKLAIDEAKASGHDLFRIAKGGEYIVCASDRVASRVVERRLTGVRFIEPRDWRFGCG